MKGEKILRRHASCSRETEIPESFRLLKLYDAAREDGHDPLPELYSYRSGDEHGFGHADNAITGLVKPTNLAEYFDPQYTFGYYHGVARALRAWADRLAVGTCAHEGGATAAASGVHVSHHQSDKAAEGEEHALERLTTLLCEHIDLLISESRRQDKLGNRETRLQVEAFTERKAQALRLSEFKAEEPREVRIGRQQRIAEALECSLAFFRAAAAAADSPTPKAERCEPEGFVSRLLGSWVTGIARISVSATRLLYQDTRGKRSVFSSG